MDWTDNIAVEIAGHAVSEAEGHFDAAMDRLHEADAAVKDAWAAVVAARDAEARALQRLRRREHDGAGRSPSPT